MSRVKIFVLYHKPSPIFKTEVLEPIQTGADDAVEDLGILKDNTGDNISKKNKNYAELTAWYWVWKNYLPAHPEVEYVGFCHYRRFLDFTRKPSMGNPFNERLFKTFARKLKNYTDDKVYGFVSQYDIVLPSKLRTGNQSVYDHYPHPRADLDTLIHIISESHPRYIPTLDSFFSSDSMYACLNFVMKRKLFEKLSTWIFSSLEKLELQTDWHSYTDYDSIRTPAYLAERFFNVWLNELVRNETVKTVHRESYLLIQKMNYKNLLRRFFTKLMIWKGRIRVFGYEFTNE